MKLLSAKIFSVDLVRKNPDKVFLFGDNLKGYGKGGQAIIRNESNAIGIPTKKAPSMDKTAFFTDAEYTSNKKVIDEAFNKIPKGKNIPINATKIRDLLIKGKKIPCILNYYNSKGENYARRTTATNRKSTH